MKASPYTRDDTDTRTTPIPDTDTRTLADLPITESDLLSRFDTDFIRTPMNERIVIECAHYEGIFEIEMQYREETYSALVWSVDYHRVAHRNRNNPKHGLMQIKPSRFDFARLGYPIDVFEGKCEVLVDKHGNIVSIMQLSASEAKYECDYQI